MPLSGFLPGSLAREFIYGRESTLSGFRETVKVIWE